VSVVFMGLRGSGKTTIARRLAIKLGCNWVDLDDVTLGAFSGCKTIAQVFERYGGAAFREAEAAALAHALSDRTARVIALGGGTPTAPGAAEMLRRLPRTDWVVVYLSCSLEIMRARIVTDAAGTSANRPSLTGDDPADEVDLVFAERDEFYRSLGDVVIDAAQPVDELVEGLVDRLRL